MASIRSANTKPEIIVRKSLWLQVLPYAQDQYGVFWGEPMLFLYLERGPACADNINPAGQGRQGQGSRAISISQGGH